MKRVLIIGKGRIGEAIRHYFKRYNLPFEVSFFSQEKDVKETDFLINALPGEIGEKGLELALKFKKDLIDISDISYSFYFKKKKEIDKKGILVFPGCGFSPGLTNLICGNETKNRKVKEIEILAGTLSLKKFYYPFLWCFEDLIEGHKSKATIFKNGKKIKVPPFSDYKKEKINGIEAESYLAEGLESLTKNLEVKNMSYRVLRPFGFFNFFSYLESYGFFKKDNIDFTKKLLELKKEDNITFGQVKVETEKEKIIWKIKSFSKKNEKLNSMQKITAVFPVVLTSILLEGKFPFKKGLFFPEKIGENKKLFGRILKETKKEILITRTY